MKYVAGLLFIITIGMLLVVIYSSAFINFKGFNASNNINQESSIKNAEARIKEVEKRILNAAQNINVNNGNSKYILTDKDRQEEILIMLKRLYIILEETKSSNLDIDLDNLATINNEIKNYNKDIKEKNIEINTINKDYNITFPSELLIKLSPEIYPTKIQNNGIFGLYLFTKVKYSTYLDSNKNIKFYILDIGYEDMKKNLELVDKLYLINENNEFLNKSFFLNKVNKDDIVRIIIETNNKTIGIELPKDKYSFVKKIINEE